MRRVWTSRRSFKMWIKGDLKESAVSVSVQCGDLGLWAGLWGHFLQRVCVCVRLFCLQSLIPALHLCTQNRPRPSNLKQHIQKPVAFRSLQPAGIFWSEFKVCLVNASVRINILIRVFPQLRDLVNTQQHSSSFYWTTSKYSGPASLWTSCSVGGAVELSRNAVNSFC